eukprot:TRINITY_DN9690_c0_g1_i1.p1 TRINITY_DN9690_c0_g1~~TRINITY_DN9690_c0_g1_i1.p1  ORF type:complete len:613 (+),score=144.63 TRINITY_DN9690_c0_g1_i1:101-1939(+)
MSTPTTPHLSPTIASNFSPSLSTTVSNTSMSPPISSLSSLKAHISFRSRQLKAFPLGIAQLTGLFTCDVSFNQISAIPEDIGLCSSLTTLYMQWNHLESVPNGIARLRHLQELHLWSNRFVHFPPAVGYITSLSVLDLNSNSISTVPSAVGTLTNLTLLNLSFNKITSLHHSIGNLSRLEKLVLNDNKIVELPPSVGRMNSLAVLLLQNNDLTTLPKEIGQLTALTTLYLQHNRLAFLPAELANLLNIRTIDVTSNGIAVIPGTFATMPELETLMIDDNPLSIPPAHVACKPTAEVLEYLRNFTAVAPSRFGDDLSSLLESEIFHDVVFKVQEKRFLCHKAVLVARCPHFQTLFMANAKKTEFDIVKYTQHIFSIFIKYIYTADFPETLSIDDLTGLKSIAADYRYTELSLLCKAVRSSRNSGTFQLAPAGSVMAQSFSKMLNEIHFFDIILSSDQKLSVKCHKAVLASRCHRFKQILLAPEDPSRFKTQPSIMRLHDLTDLTLLHIVNYIYSDQIMADMTLAVALEVYTAAHLYELERMQRLLENRMTSLLSIDDACAVYELAIKTKSETLAAIAREYIVSNYMSICVSPSFQQLNQALKQSLQNSCQAKK